MTHSSGGISKSISATIWACVAAAVSMTALAASPTEIDAHVDTLRQLYEATNIYAFNAPVLVEETAIAVKLAPGATGIEWTAQEPGFTAISLPGRPNAVVALEVRDIDSLVKFLGSQGEVYVLHTRRWTLLNNNTSFVHGGSPPVARARSRTSESTPAAARRRNGSTKLTLNIKGIDLSGSTNNDEKMLDFNLTLDMNYLRDRDGSSGSTSFETLTVDVRSKLVSGHTMLIEDVHGDEAVLFLLTLTLVGE